MSKLVSLTLLAGLSIGVALAQTNDPLMNLPADAPNEIRNVLNIGVNLLNSGNYSEALSKFSEVSRAYPNYIGAHMNSSIAYERMGRMSDSISELETSVRLSPENASVIMGLGRAYSMVGQIDKALRQYERYLWLYPNTENTEFLKGTIQRIKEETDQKDIFANSKGRDNYVEEALSQGVMRWTKDKMPIPVFIKSGNGVPGYYEQYSTVLKQSFMEWASNSAGLVSFKFVNDPQSALIDCAWVYDRGQLSNSVEGGETQATGANGVMHQVRIIICTTTADAKLSLNIKATCLHEIGHALGLLGHSSDPNDIMFMMAKSSETGLDKLSERDKKTIQNLYSMTDSTLNGYSSHTRKQAPVFGEAKNSIDKASRLNNDGVDAHKSGQFLKAAHSFELALEINPSDLAYSENAGNAYLRLGRQELQAKKYIAAQSHLELAAKYYSKAQRPDIAAQAYDELAAMARTLKLEKESKMYAQESAKMRLKIKH